VTEQDFSVLKGSYFTDDLPKTAMKKVCKWWDEKLKEVEVELMSRNS
jgi:hypothetical protein